MYWLNDGGGSSAKHLFQSPFFPGLRTEGVKLKNMIVKSQKPSTGRLFLVSASTTTESSFFQGILGERLTVHQPVECMMSMSRLL